MIGKITVHKYLDDGIMDKVDCVKQSNRIKFISIGADEELTKLSIMEESDDMSLSIENMRDMLPKDDARYVVFNFRYEIPDGSRSKTLFVMWIPGKTKIRRKIRFSSGRSTICQEINPSVSVDVRDVEDFSAENFKEKCER